MKIYRKDIKKYDRRVTKIERVEKENFINLEKSKLSEKDFSSKTKIMNILKTLRKPYFATFLASLILFISCSDSNDINSIEKRSFDLSKSINGLPIVQNLPSIDYSLYEDKGVIDKEGLTNAINQNVGTNILNSSIFDNVSLVSKNEQDDEIINDFTNDWLNSGIDTAITNLDNTLNQLNISDTEYQTYNDFINILLLSEIDFQNSSSNKSRVYAKDTRWGCAFAIASFTLATVAVGTACTPNPATPLACPIAASRAVLAYASMIAACDDL